MVMKQLIFNSFYFESGYDGHERTDFEQFILWGRVWQSLKN